MTIAVFGVDFSPIDMFMLYSVLRDLHWRVRDSRWDADPPPDQRSRQKTMV